MDVVASPDSLYPAVGMHSLGEEVLLDLNAEWGMDEDDGQMIVDSHEEDWGRLHDVRVTGTVSPGHAERSCEYREYVNIGVHLQCNEFLWFLGP